MWKGTFIEYNFSHDSHMLFTQFTRGAEEPLLNGFSFPLFNFYFMEFCSDRFTDVTVYLYPIHHQKFQVPKMEESWTLCSAIFGGWGNFPYRSRIHICRWVNSLKLTYRPSKKETSIPTIHFLSFYVSFRQGTSILGPWSNCLGRPSGNNAFKVLKKLGSRKGRRLLDFSLPVTWAMKRKTWMF